MRYIYLIRFEPDSCRFCDWEDDENCSFPAHECLQTHVRMAHHIDNSFLMGSERGF